MGRKTKDGRIEDLDFTINMTNKCNLSCKYCPLLNVKESISEETLDSYINFFLENEEKIYSLCKNVVIVFFGGECLLEFDKISKFIEKTKHLSMKYVIYTNGLDISKNIISKLENYEINKRIVFAISIDGEKDITLKYRLNNNDKLFERLLYNINLVKKSVFSFSVSKVILDDDGDKIFENMKFLHSLGPNKLFFLPVAFYYQKGFSDNGVKGIIAGLVKLFNFLESEGYSRLNILEYLGMPDDFEGIKDMYKVDLGIFGDLNGDIYGVLDGLPGYATNKTFTKKEKDKINVCSVSDSKKLLKIIESYDDFEQEMYKIGLKWKNRLYPNDDKLIRMLNIFFIKELLFYKYKPQDSC